MLVAVAVHRRGVLRASLILIGILGAAAVPGWYLWLPNYRPELRPGERYGIDVSHHQGAIDWIRVAHDGISFTYIKASEGATFVDPRFVENWSGAGDAGLDRGAYHFFSLCSSGAEQASNFLRMVPDRLELRPAVDLELSSNCSARPTVRDLRAELATFLRRVEGALGSESVLYVGDDFEDAYPGLHSIERPRWRLGFVLRPDEAWTIWQVGSYARVHGVAGPVGLDVQRTDGSRVDEAAAPTEVAPTLYRLRVAAVTLRTSNHRN
jgi:lysozyme